MLNVLLFEPDSTTTPTSPRPGRTSGERDVEYCRTHGVCCGKDTWRTYSKNVVGQMMNVAAREPSCCGKNGQCCGTGDECCNARTMLWNDDERCETLEPPKCWVVFQVPLNVRLPRRYFKTPLKHQAASGNVGLQAPIIFCKWDQPKLKCNHL